MINLMKLEVRRNSIKTYITAALIITITMTGFLYLFALLPKLDPTEPDMDMFMSYSSITSLTSILSMVCFTILSSVMYAKFIVEEYGSSKAILLFSYPIKRKKIFVAKIATVLCFTVVCSILCSYISFGLFYITETFAPISTDILTAQVVLQTFGQALFYSILAGMLALISLYFGMWKNSTPVTIVSGTIIVCITCNFLAIGLETPAIVVSFTVSVQTTAT